MPTWNEIFGRGERVEEWPEGPVQRFVSLLEASFSKRPILVWDLCCGAGRHAVAIAERGHRVFASDESPNALALLRERLTRSGLVAEVAMADMSECPWSDVRFHGVLAWDALHHNVISQIRTSVDTVHQHLVPGGFFLVTLKSTKADSFGKGKEIEPGTFVQESGLESGIPHHYFDESGIRELFADWALAVLAERVCAYRERGQHFLAVNPFDYTTWCVLGRKHGGESLAAT
jgi:SAM-dependent methyltransferase